MEISTCGQAVLYRAGLTGIPIFNVNNNCSTGSSALFLARYRRWRAARSNASLRSVSRNCDPARSDRTFPIASGRWPGMPA